MAQPAAAVQQFECRNVCKTSRAGGPGTWSVRFGWTSGIPRQRASSALRSANLPFGHFGSSIFNSNGEGQAWPATPAILQLHAPAWWNWSDSNQPRSQSRISIRSSATSDCRKGAASARSLTPRGNFLRRRAQALAIPACSRQKVTASVRSRRYPRRAPADPPLKRWWKYSYQRNDGGTVQRPLRTRVPGVRPAVLCAGS